MVMSCWLIRRPFSLQSAAVQVRVLIEFVAGESLPFPVPAESQWDQLHGR